MLVDMIVVAVLVAVAVGLLVSAGRWGRRRAELPMMLERGGLAVVALATALVVADASSRMSAGSLGAAAVCLAAAGVTRGLEDATHRRIVEDEGGLAASTWGWVGLPQVMTSLCLLSAGVVVLVARSGGIAWGRGEPDSSRAATGRRPRRPAQQRAAATGCDHGLRARPDVLGLGAHGGPAPGARSPVGERAAGPSPRTRPLPPGRARAGAAGAAALAQG